MFGANSFLLTCKTLQASSCVVFLRFTPFTSRILSPWWIDPSLYAMLSSDWNKITITWLNNLVPFQSIRACELWGHADLVNRRPSPARQGPVFLSIARGGFEGFWGNRMVFRGDPRRISPCQQSIEVGLEKIDCLLTANEGDSNNCDRSLHSG